MSTASAFPWRDGKTLDDAIASARPWFLAKEMILPGTGHTGAEIKEAEETIGSSLPPELGWFYRQVKPTTSDKASFTFTPLDELTGWVLLDDMPPPWQQTSVLVIGEGQEGSMLLWVMGHPKYPNGTVAGFHHEGFWDDMMVAIVARTFAEFLTKVVCCKGFYPGTDDDDEPVSQAVYDLQVRELKELNST